jgi:hypothetical protein
MNYFYFFKANFNIICNKSNGSPSLPENDTKQLRNQNKRLIRPQKNDTFISNSNIKSNF